jgi:hypothetical protein
MERDKISNGIQVDSADGPAFLIVNGAFSLISPMRLWIL